MSRSKEVPGQDGEAYKATEKRNQTRYKLVILDFHGTMTDNQLRLIKSLHEPAHTALGIHLGKQFYKEALTRPSKTSGNGESITQFIVDTLGGKYPDETVKKFIEEQKKVMDRVYIPIPGIRKALKDLIEDGLDIVVLTNGKNRDVVQDRLRAWGFSSLADNLYSSHITGARKPDTRPILHILSDLRKQGKEFKPSEVLMVGDYIDDMTTATRMCMDSVLIVRGNGWEEFHVREPKPTFLITNPLVLVEIVRGKIVPKNTDMVRVPPTLWSRENWGPAQINRVNL